LADKTSNVISFSIIIETTQRSSVQTMTFTLSNYPSPPKSLYVWKTNENNWLVMQNSIPVTGNKFTLDLDPQSIYTITTTTGQGKAKEPTPAASKPFPLPYSDTFDEYATEATVKYFSDQGGSWTSRPDPTKF